MITLTKPNATIAQVEPPRRMRDTARDSAVAIILLLIPIGLRYLLRRDTLLFPFLFGATCAILATAVVVLRTPILRNISLSLATVFAIIFGLELYLAVAQGDHPVRDEGTYTNGYFLRGGPLGYGPRPGIRVTSRRTVGDRVVFDVTYTITPQGIRATPGSRPGGDTVLFFGCSFTFGEGVNDDETLPFYFARGTGFKYNVVNLGFHGYGPHQMLRSLQLQLPNQIITGRVKAVIFQTGLFHIWRSMGMSPWDKDGPRYHLEGNARAVYTPRSFLRVPQVFDKAVGKSKLVEFVTETLQNRPGRETEAVELYAAIIEEAAYLVRQRYGCKLTLLYWDHDFHVLSKGDRETTQRLLTRFLGDRDIQLLRASGQVPAFAGEYTIVGDGHPSPLAHRLNAEALIRRLE